MRVRVEQQNVEAMTLVMGEGATVGDLKARIHDCYGIPANLQTLYAGSKKLADSTQLVEFKGKNSAHEQNQQDVRVLDEVVCAVPTATVCMGGDATPTRTEQSRFAVGVSDEGVEFEVVELPKVVGEPQVGKDEVVLTLQVELKGGCCGACADCVCCPCECLWDIITCPFRCIADCCGCS